MNQDLSNIENSLLDENENKDNSVQQLLEKISSNPELLEALSNAVNSQSSRNKRLKTYDYELFNIVVYSKDCEKCNGLKRDEDNNTCSVCEGKGKGLEEYPVIKFSDVETIRDAGDMIISQDVKIWYLRHDLPLVDGKFIEETKIIPYTADFSLTQWCGLKKVMVKSTDIKISTKEYVPKIAGIPMTCSILDSNGYEVGRDEASVKITTKQYAFEFNGRKYSINSKYVNVN